MRTCIFQRRWPYTNELASSHVLAARLQPVKNPKSAASYSFAKDFARNFALSALLGNVRLAPSGAPVGRVPNPYVLLEENRVTRALHEPLPDRELITSHVPMSGASPQGPNSESYAGQALHELLPDRELVFA